MLLLYDGSIVHSVKSSRHVRWSSQVHWTLPSLLNAGWMLPQGVVTDLPTATLPRKMPGLHPEGETVQFTTSADYYKFTACV